MKTQIALMGAGGKMGRRITGNLKDHVDYTMRYVEVSELGIANLKELGVEPMPQTEAIPDADVVILALPDLLIGRISAGIVPELKPGAMVIGLDPAAAYAGVLPEREDISYFVTHPCHPPLFLDDPEPEARTDWFGGIHARQNIVCALHQGPEEAYALGEKIARDLYAPVLRSHRVTTEQMAVLEPGLVETFTATCITVMREGMDKVIEMGVPEPAVRDFLMGHIRIELAILFDYAGFPFSDGARYAIEQARPKIFREDWDQVLTLPEIQKSVREITGRKTGSG